MAQVRKWTNTTPLGYANDEWERIYSDLDVRNFDLGTGVSNSAVETVYVNAFQAWIFQNNNSQVAYCTVWVPPWFRGETATVRAFVASNGTSGGNYWLRHTPVLLEAGVATAGPSTTAFAQSAPTAAVVPEWIDVISNQSLGANEEYLGVKLERLGANVNDTNGNGMYLLGMTLELD